MQPHQLNKERFWQYDISHGKQIISFNGENVNIVFGASISDRDVHY